MATLIAVVAALGVGAAIGFGYGTVLRDERAYRAGWHDCLDRLCHPAERRRMPLPPRPLPTLPAPRGNSNGIDHPHRGLGTLDAALLGVTLAALLIGASMIFGG